MDSATEYARADDLAVLSIQEYVGNFLGEEQEQAREVEELYPSLPVWHPRRCNSNTISLKKKGGIGSKMACESRSPRDARVKKIARPLEGSVEQQEESWMFHAYLTEGWDEVFPFPTGLKVDYDG